MVDDPGGAGVIVRERPPAFGRRWMGGQEWGHPLPHGVQKLALAFAAGQR